MFSIRIAGLNIQIDNRFEFVENICRGFYATGSETNFSVSVTEDEISNEKALSGGELSDGFCESVCIYRAIAERLYKYDAFVFHCAAIETNGKAYCFTAKRGTGKTTHIGLWKRVYGDKISIINGDKPIVRFKNGVPYICGTPWGGKENLRSNRHALLASVCFLEQAADNSICTTDPQTALTKIVHQIYLPTNGYAADKTIALAGKMLELSSVYTLKCNISDDAAKMSYLTMTDNAQ